MSASGIPAPSADLPNWKLHFVDDFLTDCPLGAFPIYGVANAKTPAAVAAKWTSYPDNYQVTRKNVGGFYRSERTVTIHDGMLDIHMHYDPTISEYCCAAPIPRLYPAQTAKWLMASHLYGRYEVCLKQGAPSGTYKIAWLLWPDSGGNTLNGEIDCPEVNLNEATNVHGFCHEKGGSQVSADMGVKLGGWHRYAIEWSPGRVAFLTDEVVKKVVTTNIPNTPMHWILQSELGLGTYPLSKTDSVDLLCDWVAFWEPK